MDSAVNHFAGACVLVALHYWTVLYRSCAWAAHCVASSLSISTKSGTDCNIADAPRAALSHLQRREDDYHFCQSTQTSRFVCRWVLRFALWATLLRSLVRVGVTTTPPSESILSGAFRIPTPTLVVTALVMILHQREMPALHSEAKALSVLSLTERACLTRR